MTTSRSLATKLPAAKTVRGPMPTSENVRQYLPLVGQAVARFLRRLPPSVLKEDLVAAGTCGLLDALRKGPEDRGPAFEWYVRLRIRGAIIDELRTQDWLTRRARKAAQVVTEGTTANCVGIVGIVRLDDLTDHARAATLTDAAAQTPLEVIERNMNRSALAKAVEQLPEREQKIVRMHYFMDIQFKVIATELGVSEPRISQLHARAMTKLKSLLRCEHDEAA